MPSLELHHRIRSAQHVPFAHSLEETFSFSFLSFLSIVAGDEAAGEFRPTSFHQLLFFFL